MAVKSAQIWQRELSRESSGWSAGEKRFGGRRTHTKLLPPRPRGTRTAHGRRPPFTRGAFGQHCFLFFKSLTAQVGRLVGSRTDDHSSSQNFNVAGRPPCFSRNLLQSIVMDVAMRPTNCWQPHRSQYTIGFSSAIAIVSRFVVGPRLSGW